MDQLLDPYRYQNFMDLQHSYKVNFFVSFSFFIPFFMMTSVQIPSFYLVIYLVDDGDFVLRILVLCGACLGTPACQGDMHKHDRPNTKPSALYPTQSNLMLIHVRSEYGNPESNPEIKYFVKGANRSVKHITDR
jgi:hypothetical protein